MNKTYVLIALSSFTLACAAQTTNDDEAPGQTAPGMQQMRGRMQDMQDVMDRIHKTEDPRERQRLLREHMQSMQQGMMMMEQMMAQMTQRRAEEPAAKPDGSEDHEFHH